MSEFELGKCKECGRWTALKNNLCVICQNKKTDFGDLFGGAFGSYFGEK